MMIISHVWRLRLAVVLVGAQRGNNQPSVHRRVNSHEPKHARRSTPFTRCYAASRHNFLPVFESVTVEIL